MRVQSPVWVDPLEEGMATHSGILAWRVPWTEESGGLRSTWLERVRHDWSDLACMHHSSTTILRCHFTLPRNGSKGIVLPYWSTDIFVQYVYFFPSSTSKELASAPLDMFPQLPLEERWVIFSIDTSSSCLTPKVQNPSIPFTSAF